MLKNFSEYLFRCTGPAVKLKGQLYRDGAVWRARHRHRARHEIDERLNGDALDGVFPLNGFAEIVAEC